MTLLLWLFFISYSFGASENLCFVIVAISSLSLLTFLTNMLCKRHKWRYRGNCYNHEWLWQFPPYLHLHFKQICYANDIKHIRKDTQEMPQLRSTTLPRHQMKESWGTNYDKTNVTWKYESTAAQTRRNTTALEWSVGQLFGNYTSFTRAKPHLISWCSSKQCTDY